MWYRLLANIKCSQGGHFLTNELLKKVFANQENYTVLEIKEKTLPHTLINKNLLKSIAKILFSINNIEEWKLFSLLLYF